jgi:hypothetical protein
MLQFALLLLGCAISQYLWTISRTVAEVIDAVTLSESGVTSCLPRSRSDTLLQLSPPDTFHSHSNPRQMPNALVVTPHSLAHCDF